MANDPSLRKVQVKSVRSQPWYVNVTDFTGELKDQVTIYVLLGGEDGKKSVRYFMARNCELAEHVSSPSGWKTYGFMPMTAVKDYEDRWDVLLVENAGAPQTEGLSLD